MPSTDDLDDLDAALASIDVDKDFQMSFMNFDGNSNNNEDSSADFAVNDAEPAFSFQQLQRPEVFSHRYRPTRDEDAEIQKLCDFLKVGSKAGWGADRTVHQLLNHEGGDKNIILLRGSLALPDGNERQLVLLTHGFILAKVDGGGMFTTSFDVAELYDNVVYVKDRWMTSSNDSFCLKLANDKEITLASTKKSEWLDALERVLLQNRLHSKTRDEAREFGWQYKLVQTSVYTAAVTGASFFSDDHLKKKDNLDEYHKMAPLHYAAMYNHAHIVTALLDYGADPEVKDGDGRTPMYYAQREDNELSQKALRDHGAADSTLFDQEQNGELAHNVAEFEEERSAKRKEEAAKQELFAGATVPTEEEGTTKPSFFSAAFAGLAAEEHQSSDKKVEAVHHHATAAHSQMAENIRLIHERGEKINELGDKADKLEENVAEYGSLAAQLKAKMRKEDQKLSLPFSMPKISVPMFRKTNSK